MFAKLNEDQSEVESWVTSLPAVGRRWVDQPVFDEEGNETGTERVRAAVSNFHLLPNEILKEEGWLPVEEDESAVGGGQVRDGFTYTVEEARVVRHWIGVDPPEPAPLPESLPSIEDRVDALARLAGVTDADLDAEAEKIKDEKAEEEKPKEEEKA